MNCKIALLILFFSFSSCGSSAPKETSAHSTGEYIYRLDEEKELLPRPVQLVSPEPYPWQHAGFTQKVQAITKEYFRCKGSALHPPHIVLKEAKETGRFYDCQGAEKHSLPIRGGKEFICPILLELLNEIQKKTGKAVIITSGHRCPTHNAYLDSRPKAQGSKHQIGAEVDFYVQGYEEKPEQVLQIILNFYKNQAVKEYQTFSRFEKETDVTTAPWYNKEVFIKLYKRSEGRNFDNRHPYPYLNLQVRFDKEKNERVSYSPELAQQFLRK